MSAVAFRQYDVRGLVGRELDEDFYHRLGLAFGTRLGRMQRYYWRPLPAVGRVPGRPGTCEILSWVTVTGLGDRVGLLVDGGGRTVRCVVCAK